MKPLRIYARRTVIIILMLQLMNVSIQAHPANEVMLANSYQDNNRIDDAVEYVLEILMHKKDAIPEDRHQKQDRSFHGKITDFKLVVPSQNPVLPVSTVVEMRKPFSQYRSYSYRFSTEINPPPPKA